MQPLSEIKLFWSTTKDFLLKSFLPQFERWGDFHDFTISAGSQTNYTFSDNGTMTAEFYKHVYQKTYLPNDFRPRILGNKKTLEKFQIGRQMPVRNVPSRHNVLVIRVKNYTETDVKVSLSYPI